MLRGQRWYQVWVDDVGPATWPESMCIDMIRRAKVVNVSEGITDDGHRSINVWTETVPDNWAYDMGYRFIEV